MPASSTESNPNSTPSTAAPARCTQTTHDGRRCTSLLYPGHASLCHHHLRQQLDRAPLTEDIAGDILSSIASFQSAASINTALARILTLLAAGRIKRQDAIAMSYICQLMLQSLKGFKQEINLTRYEPLWERDLAKVLFSRIPLEDFIAPTEPEESEEAAEPEKSEPKKKSEEKPDQKSAAKPQEKSTQKPTEKSPIEPKASANVVQGFSPAPIPATTSAPIAAPPPPKPPAKAEPAENKTTNNTSASQSQTRAPAA